MKMIAALSVTLLALLALSSQPALAQSGFGNDAKAKVELLMPAQAKPGDTIDVGVKFTMQKDWHIYWVNPGDSGQPPKFSFGLPGGGASRMMRGGEWTSTPPAFPTPHKFDAGGGLVGYGYSDTVIFPATITIPATATPGQNLEVELAVDYLICADICIPEQAYVTAAIELTPAPEDADRQMSKQLDEAKAEVPTKATSEPTVEDLGEGRYRVSVDAPGAKKADLFVNVPSGLEVSDIKSTGSGSTASFEYSVRRYAGANVRASEMSAVIGYDTAKGRRGLEIVLPVPAEQ